MCLAVELDAAEHDSRGPKHSVQQRRLQPSHVCLDESQFHPGPGKLLRFGPYDGTCCRAARSTCA